jgi:hypothetical protein
MSGDQIRILAANPLGQVQGISQFCLQGCNLGQATIVTESNPPPLEVDTFPLPQAQMTLAIPIPGDGTRMETVNLAGSAVVQTTIGMGGETGDSNNNGLDDAPTVMTSLNLSGSSSLGTVLVTLDPSQPTLGMIEEQTNKFRGVLDLPPFAVSGTASSYFDIFFDVTIGGVVLHSAKPAHMAAIITHKPPGPGDTFNSTNTMPIDLLSTNGQASGYQFISGTFVPNCVPPRITVSSVANGRATFCWPALCGTAFQVQCATNLIPPIGWQPLTNAVLTTNGLYCVSVTLTNGSRFYRLAR